MIYLKLIPPEWELQYLKKNDIEDITKGLPNLQNVIMVPYLNTNHMKHNVITWENIRQRLETLDFEIVSFNRALVSPALKPSCYHIKILCFHIKGKMIAMRFFSKVTNANSLLFMKEIKL